MSDDAPVAFPQSADAVVATLTELFRHQGNRLACEVLENAKARIEETGYDNWNAGTYLFTLFLDLPLKVFAPIEPDVSRMEKVIAGKLTSVLRNTGNAWLREVTISPILEQPPIAVDPKVAPVDVEHLWLPGMLRLFLTHVSAHKVAVSKLKWELRKFGISSFVAHEDIEPTLEWQREIELALRSMHALVALLTPDFHESKWTDQEVGFALGKGVLVIPVRLGLDPYGFIGKLQGSSSKLDAPDTLASGVVDLLLKNKTTAGTMREALIVGLEKAPSFAASKAIAGKMQGLKYFTTEQLTRMESACKDNDQVTQSFGVPERLQKIVLRFKPPATEDAPTF
jgi:hypothetical protein